MKLLRFKDGDTVRTGIQKEDGTRLDTSAFGQDYNEDFLANNGITKLAEWLKTNEDKCPSIPSNAVLDSCIARPSKIICIGLNYAKHAAEAGMEPPSEPLVFFKSTSALCGPNDDTIIPRNSEKTDWEVELAVVIGKKASYINESEALDYVAGYCIHNDLSERAFQLEKGGQWVKGKSNDTFAPLGPFMATTDEIPNPQALRLWLKRNGTMLQDSNTDDMIFGVAETIAYLSNFMTLLPGDVISTGTPAGVGMGLKPPTYLKEGDEIVLGIDGLGEQRQIAKNYKV